jgi:hypothetical protein
MSRVVALVIAITLIGGAVLVRKVIDDDGGTSERSVTRVVCAEELRDACEHLGFGARYQIRIEDAPVTASRLASSEPDFDLWAVPAPWPAMVDDMRERAGTASPFEASSTLAGTRLAVYGDESLSGCDWRCLGDKAGAGLTIGSRSLTSGLGVLTVGAAASGWFGGPDFATNDFDADFDRWLAALTDAIEPTSNPVNQLLQSRAFFDVAISLEAEARTALDRASADRKEGLALLYPSPVATVTAVVAPVHDQPVSEQDSFEAALRHALVDRGWSGDVAAETGLPSAGVLIALQDRVR